MLNLVRPLLSCVLPLILCAAAAHSQSVNGVIRDESRGMPVPGARLHLLDSAGATVDSARSDRSGRFRLAAPGAGSFTVFFQMDGWASVPSSPVALRQGTATDFEFTVPLVAVAAIREMSDIISMETRLQSALPELCGEPFRAWEAGLLVGVVRVRATRQPIPGARVAVVDASESVARATLSSENGVYVLCNVPTGTAVRIRIALPDGTEETTDVEIRAGSASWYDLPVGPRRR